jgi:hypothetical protein
MFSLFCGKSPRRLGIEATDGSWNMAVFREHVESCPQCTCGAGKIMGMIASRTSPLKAASSRANAGKPPKPGKLPRGRPRKKVPAPE